MDNQHDTVITKNFCDLEELERVKKVDHEPTHLDLIKRDSKNAVGNFARFLKRLGRDIEEKTENWDKKGE